MKITAGKRRIDYDLIRILACASVLIFHFNASVCGFDTVGQLVYPNELIPSVYFGCVSLGDIGNNLFFMLSGAALMGSRKIASGKDLTHFYLNRAEKLMPPFYIAWLWATCAQLLMNKTISGAPIPSLLLTLFGMDGYGSARGWFTNNFYQVGEWYLGCAIICYLLWPLVMYLWDHLPAWVFLPLVALMYGITVFSTDGNLITVPVRLTQMIAGGCFARYIKQMKNIQLIGTTVAVTIAVIMAQKYIHAVTVGFVVCWMIFLLISLLVACFPAFFQAISSAIISAAALTYPIFLVHHKLISLMVKGFDLAHFTYRYVLVLFVIYFVLAVLIAKMLKRTTSAAMNVIKQRRASCSEQHSDD